MVVDVVGRLWSEYPNLFYASRKVVVQVMTHSKAANLNFGLLHVCSMKGRSDYVAIVDVDVMLEPD